MTKPAVSTASKSSQRAAAQPVQKKNDKNRDQKLMPSYFQGGEQASFLPPSVPIGNGTVSSAAVQAKLTLGAPDDHFEREADHTADKVMRMPAGSEAGVSTSFETPRISSLQRSTELNAPLQREEQETKGEEEMLQGKLQRQSDDKDEKIAQAEVQRQEDSPQDQVGEEPMMQPKIQRQEGETAEQEELPQDKLQRQVGEEQELMMQPKIQREEEEVEEQEESPQDKLQRQVGEEQELMMQPKIQREEEEVEEQEESPQDKLQRQLGEEQEAMMQPKVQREEEEAEEPEEMAQPKLQRQIEDEKKRAVQRKANKQASTLNPQTSSRIQGLVNQGGQSLPESERAFFEPRFGRDFSNVRIHTGTEAAQVSKGINARAFTLGKNIVFNSGQYRPGTTEGRRLMAHELTHTIQQGAVVRKSTHSKTGGARVQRSSLGTILNKVAQFIPGYKLLTVIIGWNPLLNKKVPRTVVNFVGGLLSLTPGGALLFQKLRKTRMLSRAFGWLRKEVRKLNFSVAYFKSLLSKLWENVSILNSLKENIRIGIRTFRAPVVRLKNFVFAIGRKIKKLIAQGLFWLKRTFFMKMLKLAGVPVKQFMGILNKGRFVLKALFFNPIGFVKNLFRAVKGGLKRFLKNIKKHLIGGLVGWLFGAFSRIGIQLPQKFNLKGVFSIVLQVLGLTYPQIRERIVRRLGPRGEQIMSGLERTVTFVQDLMKRGPIAIWERVQNSIGNLKQIVMEGIRNWIIKKIFVEGITWLFSLLNPAGALVKVLKALFNVVMFFVERYQQIVAFASSVINSIAAIARGRIGKAARAVELSLARSIPIMIGFMASLLNITGVTDTIKKIIARLRRPIDKALDKVIRFLVKKGRTLFGKGKALAKKGVKKVLSWWRAKRPFKQGKERHTLQFSGIGKSARLIVKSTPTPLEVYLGKVEAKHTSSSAKKVITNIKSRITKINKLKKESDGKNKSIGVAAGEKIMAHLTKIAELLATFGKQENRPPSQISWTTKKLIADEVGWEMEAKPLSINPGGHSGFEPRDTSDIWEFVRQRKGVYIRGHLLNHHVHGPGRNKNLVPITGDLNGEMERKVESKVKNMVLGENEVVAYTVKAKGSHPKRNHLPQEALLPKKLEFTLKSMQLKSGKTGQEASDWKEGKKVTIPSSLTHTLPEDTPLDEDAERLVAVNLSTAKAGEIGHALAKVEVNNSMNIAHAIVDLRKDRGLVFHSWRALFISIKKKIKETYPREKGLARRAEKILEKALEKGLIKLRGK